MSFKTPAELNRRLGQVQFLGCAADYVYFERLAGLVRGMKRDTDKFEIPEANAAYAWRTCYSLYYQLVEREERERLTESNSAEDQRLAAVNQNWTDFLRAHELLKDLIRRDELDGVALEYLGIEKGDLDNPIRPHDPNSRDPYPRRSDWLDVSTRVSNALTEWTRMSPDEKRSIPSRLKTMRLERRLSKLERCVAELQDQLLQKERAA